VWDNAADQNQKYDVWILPAEGSQKDAPALFQAKGVRSPVAFSELQAIDAAKGAKELQPGKPYRMLVCLANLGRLAGITVPFQTTAEADGGLHVPPDAAAALAKAKRLGDEGRPGDGLMVLAAMPDPQRETPEAKALEQELRELVKK
jgi:hypothetical protein